MLYEFQAKSKSEKHPSLEFSYCHKITSWGAPSTYPPSLSGGNMNNEGIPNDRKDDLDIMNSTGPSVVGFLQISIKTLFWDQKE